MNILHLTEETKKIRSLFSYLRINLLIVLQYFFDKFLIRISNNLLILKLIKLYALNFQFKLQITLFNLNFDIENFSL